MNQPPSPVYAGVDIAKATLQLHFQTRQHLLARAFTTELARVGSPLPVSAMTGWFIVIYHRRTFTGWTGSLMGCELRTQRGRRRKTSSAGLGGLRVLRVEEIFSECDEVGS